MAKPPKAGAMPVLKSRTGIPIHFPWNARRRRIDLILLYCAIVVGYLAVYGPDAVKDTIALGLVGLAVTTVGSYIFGAAWDDNNARKAAVQSESIAEGVEPPADVQVEAETVEVKAG